MNDLIVMLILAALAGLALCSCLRRRKRGCGDGCGGCDSCGGGCGGCGGSCKGPHSHDNEPN